MSARLLTAAFIFLSAFSCCAEEANPLIGRWVVQRVNSRGATKLPVQIEWEFTTDKVIVRDAGASEEVSRNPYTVDLSKNPTWITITVLTERREGIFRVVGEELHLRQAIDGGPRPTEFPKDGYMVLKRREAKRD